MKKIISNIKKGLIVYTTFMLGRINKLPVDQLKKTPKEAFVLFSEIISVSTEKMPENWIEIKTIHNKTYYEDKSILSFIRIVADNSEFIFQKISKGFAINVNLLKYKSNLTLIELSNGENYTVNQRFKGRLKEAILKIWEG